MTLRKSMPLFLVMLTVMCALPVASAGVVVINPPAFAQSSSSLAQDIIDSAQQESSSAANDNVLEDDNEFGDDDIPVIDQENTADQDAANVGLQDEDAVQDQDVEQDATQEDFDFDVQVGEAVQQSQQQPPETEPPPQCALEITADKEIYGPGDVVAITVTNTGSEPVDFPNSALGLQIKNVDTGEVFPLVAAQVITTLEPGESRTFEFTYEDLVSEIGSGLISVTVTSECAGVEEVTFRLSEAPPPDTTAPIITVPADMIVEATNEQGAVVAYEVTAQDDRDGTVPVECTPASGSSFPIGSTMVECTATDAAGNIGRASFTVTVNPVPDEEGLFCFYGLFETPCFNTEQECEIAHTAAREQGVALTECERFETPPEGLTIVIEEERSTCDPPDETGASFSLYFLVIGLPADISDYVYAELVSSDGVRTIVLSGWSRDVGEFGYTGGGILTTLDVGEPPYTLTYYEATGPENPEDATIDNIVPLEGGRTASVTFTCEDLEADVPWIVIR